MVTVEEAIAKGKRTVNTPGTNYNIDSLKTTLMELNRIIKVYQGRFNKR